MQTFEKYMKWFQHDTDTSSDPKIQLLRNNFKVAGIGIYFEIDRLIAKNVDDKNLEDWGYLPIEYTENKELLVYEIGADSVQQLDTVIQFCVDKGLLYKHEDRILNPKVLERADRYTAQICAKKGIVLSDYVQKLYRLCKVSTPTLHNNTVHNITLDTGDKRPDKIIETGKEKSNYSIGHILASRVIEKTNTTKGISTAWQEKALRWAKDLGITLEQADRGRWFKVFKDASIGRKSANLESAYGFLKDSPTFKAISKQEKLSYFFSIYENGLPTKFNKTLQGGSHE